MNDLVKPLPHTEEPLTVGYWEGTAKGELRVRKCGSCGSLQFPPREMCKLCHSQDFDWVEVSGKASLFTYSPSIFPAHPSFQDDAPYAVVIVELEEGPRMLGRATNVAVEDLKIGMPMQAVFQKASDDATLVYWEPANGAGD